MSIGGGAARTGGYEARRDPAGMARPIASGTCGRHDGRAPAGGTAAGAGRHRVGGTAGSRGPTALPISEVSPRQRLFTPSDEVDPGSPMAESSRRKIEEAASSFLEGGRLLHVSRAAPAPKPEFVGMDLRGVEPLARRF
jgi:hypothetical protein